MSGQFKNNYLGSKMRLELNQNLDGRDVSPLVSVLIRSMDRPTLHDALESVAHQTYSKVEVIVIPACGSAHSPLGKFCGNFPLTMAVASGPLSRSQAANLGLQTARGAYLIFLDDDDLWLPEHVSKLVDALAHAPNRVAYTGVKLVNASGDTVLTLDEPWEPSRLRGANYIPIHAVLFERTLLESGCHFNDSLECMEDWEFWLQLSQHTSFQHVPGVSAVYRHFLGNSGLSIDGDAEKHLVNRSAIFEMWQPRFSSREWVQTIFWFETSRNQFASLASDRLALVETATQQLERTELELAHARSDNLASAVQINALSVELSGVRTELIHSQERCADIDAQWNADKAQIAALKNVASDHAAQASELGRVVQDLVHSTSWRITGPLRFVSRLLNGQHHQAMDGLRRRARPLARWAYYRMPPTWRGPLLDMAFRIGAPLFRGMGHYEIWRQHNRLSQSSASYSASSAISALVDIASIAPIAHPPAGKIAIHAHIFYENLVAEFSSQLAHMPFGYDLFVSVPTEGVRQICEKSFTALPHLEQLTVRVVPNRGRDIAPMFCTFGATLRTYDFIAHIHGKKSLYNNGATAGWREYLLTSLLGSSTQIRSIFSLMVHDDSVGIVYPQNFAQLPYFANTWLSNRSQANIFCAKLGITDIPHGFFNFPAGSMFWARTDALKPLFDLELRLEDFPEETGQKDATTAHCLERLLALTANKAGLKTAILHDASTPRWSMWGLESYLARNQQWAESAVSAPGIRLVVFDIFDTLLVRPFLDPECIKEIVAKRAEVDAGSVYTAMRTRAESTARQRAGRDVGLDAIYSEFAEMSGLGKDEVNRLRCLEEAIELSAVSPRAEVVALLRHALAQGKRVVLASDMYLPKSVIESMLAHHGISGWQALYLSSDVGMRKDSGKLYTHILACESVSPSDVLMVGDNEHSDLQIPSDMGIHTVHVLRPVELARNVPRLGHLIDRAVLAKNLNEQLTLGLIVRENFHPVFYPAFDPFALIPVSPTAIGYSVLGPLALAFAQWLSRTSVNDAIDRLYFLSREGQFLKTVYDRWVAHIPGAVQSDYLVLSRRTVTVPMIASVEDIYIIARARYFPNKLSNFIFERFGLELSDELWQEIAMQSEWRRDKLVEVVDEKIDHLKPLLAALAPKIIAQGQVEHPGLMAYLDELGLNSEVNVAVVDIGYAGTIQGRLNRLLMRKVHGYYMITDQRADVVSRQHGVLAQGCFGQGITADANAPALLSQSFALEKLLSSDDAQVVRYLLNSAGVLISEHRELSQAELQTRVVRHQIQAGALKFVDDAIGVKNKLADSFLVPPGVASAIYEAFMKRQSDSERAVIGSMVLDDYYCGRGLVS